MNRKSSFAPVVDQRCRILILGSLPGEASLRATQYYAHPQNRFWELVGSAIGIELRSLAYEIRIDTLRDHKIGLWDVIADAKREGSLDSAIREPRNNDLQSLGSSLPDLQAIAFNGKKAAMTGRKQLEPAGRRYRLIDLPSSSPAYAAMPIAEKLSHWAVIGSIAGNPETAQK
ncbi:DNA-deoxyinosine glycosylase [Parasphingopyxis sp. CP4]|uniref:DNA-deoxyinosine glycosylase n=1 Tax=Parasphingopyxis sp. CP4 TaxID=2724527 RepID=UPI0015A06839|nr:DNA-deoxyinosine glycosylase [Parasphingopyxis sp. CP4]QLC23306.1 DNA-deoxyinosine glycosylase [Parasphingopyxis sp. CP4]